MNVYVCRQNFFPIKPFIPLLKKFNDTFVLDNKSKFNDLVRCPAFIKELSNTYAVESYFDYQLEWDGNSLNSRMYNQEFFNDNVISRELENGFFSLFFPNFIFLAEKSLEMSLISPFLEKNDFSKKVVVIPGMFNIGKHVRPIETPFIFKDKSEISINEGDLLCYLKFHTDEKINFIPFLYTSEMDSIIKSNLKLRYITKKPKPLTWWYNFNSETKLFNKLLKLAKSNIF